MLDKTKLLELATCLKAISKEQERLDKFNSRSISGEISVKRSRNAAEDAREAAIEIRRLKHEAHCLAVESGIADRRSDEHYQDSVAPCGFGNYRKFYKRAKHRRSRRASRR